MATCARLVHSPLVSHTNCKCADALANPHSMTSSKALILLWLFASALPGRGATVVDSEICVYGATSGGVAAAVAAARLGKNVALVTYDSHVGGMSSGGLGVTDRGNTSSIGGIAAEFYRREGVAYGSCTPVTWV